jgi:hypothetical protein
MLMLREMLERTVSELRLGREGSGSAALARFLDELWAGLKQQEIRVSPELEQVLQETLQAQHRGDFLYVADLMEYELKGLF